MTLLLSCQDVEKSHGSRILFKNISMGIYKGDQIGLVGPNGSGKTSFLKIIAQKDKPDGGNISFKKELRVGYVPQDSRFPDKTVEEILLDAQPEYERGSSHENIVKVDILLSKVGFEDYQQKASSLSGGWRKRLDLAKALIINPDLLLLDEPTNHLDLESIEWLESFLKRLGITYVIVSHDRYFLNNVTNRMMELNRAYPTGLFSADCAYNRFIELRDEFLRGQVEYEKSLRSTVRREVEWLKQNPKARTTKQSARIQEADRLITELSNVESRNQKTISQIDFSSSDRQTRKLVVAKNIGKSMGGKSLFSKLDFTLSPSTRMGIAGANGTGKTTLLKILNGEIQPDFGTLKYADGLQIAYFDQHRDQLPPHVTLKQALAANNDFVNYRGSNIHVNSWSKRFLFSPERLDLPISELSGGERARILIARLMLKPADVLLLDEPTNDLDIPTLEVLEESLREFNGAIVMITHDRTLLENISNVILGITPFGTAGLFADYQQWEAFLKSERSDSRKDSSKEKVQEKEAITVSPVSTSTKKLSYHEKRELEQMEANILSAEKDVVNCQAKLDEAALSNNANLLQEACEKMNIAQERLEKLFARWQELEDKKN